MMRECEKALNHILDDRNEDLSSILLLGAAGLAQKGGTFWSPYKGDYDAASARGAHPVSVSFKTGAPCEVLIEKEETRKWYKIAIIGTKQKEETTGLIAGAILDLHQTAKETEKETTLYIALENDWGGKRLEKIIGNWGLTPNGYSKHKSRVVWANIPATLPETVLADLDKAVEAAAPHARKEPVPLLTQAGVFSFEKQDRGTVVLIDVLDKYLSDPSLFSANGHPYPIKGKGADFGCGIGDLAFHILKNIPAVEMLHALDHDLRSVECVKANLAEFGTRTFCQWTDICYNELPKGLDFVIMNPPFHSGKTEMVNLGKIFITRAAECLKPRGLLVMVANTHLPYEAILEEHFKHVHQAMTQDGFKIILAVKN